MKNYKLVTNAMILDSSTPKDILKWLRLSARKWEDIHEREKPLPKHRFFQLLSRQFHLGTGYGYLLGGIKQHERDIYFSPSRELVDHDGELFYEFSQWILPYIKEDKSGLLNCPNSSKKRLVVISGAGMSQESGIKTFRDKDGLWANHKIKDVATLEGWSKDPQRVLDFYNKQRDLMRNAKPHCGHHALVELEKRFNVTTITQNIDGLHQKAGASMVIELHGNIFQAKSSDDESLVYQIKDDYDMAMGDLCDIKSQLRPNIIWFGEGVPFFEKSKDVIRQADIVVIIGTSLKVEPCASLVNHIDCTSKVFHINPDDVPIKHNYTHIRSKAVAGLSELVDLLRNDKLCKH